MTSDKNDCIRIVSIHDLIENDVSSSSRHIAGVAIVSDNISSQRLFDLPGISSTITILICLRGIISLNINSRQYTLAPETTAVLLPNDIVRVDNNSGTEGYIVSITPEYIDHCGLPTEKRSAVVKSIRENPVRPLSDDEIGIIGHYIPLLCNSMSRPDEEITTGLLKALYNYLSDLYLRQPQDIGTGDKGRAGEIFTLFTRLMNDSACRHRTLGQFAAELGLSPNYLSRMVKEYSGKLPADWIRNHVMTKAMNLLRYSDKTVKEISFLLGFPSQSAFSKFFCHKTGISPASYRNQGSGH